MQTEEKIKLRSKCNFLLENVIKLNLSLFPDLRYIQNLWVLSIIDGQYRNVITRKKLKALVSDGFYEEPYDTVVRILPRITKLINEQFPKKARTNDKIKRSNIFTCLEELNLAKKTEDFKLELIKD